MRRRPSAPPRGFEWIPHATEAETDEVPDVDGRELRDPVVDQGQGSAGIAEPSEREVRGPRLVPEGVMQGSAFRREPDETPSRMASVGLDDFYGVPCRRGCWMTTGLRSRP